MVPEYSQYKISTVHILQYKINFFAQTLSHVNMCEHKQKTLLYDTNKNFPNQNIHNLCVLFTFRKQYVLYKLQAIDYLADICICARSCVIPCLIIYN